MAKTLRRYQVALLLGLALWGTGALGLPSQARAEVPLTRAVIQSLRNRVRLLLKNQSPRPARVRDAMIPGDAVFTAQASRAELRFNDGSLARVGEQALFQFLPNTRTFRLNNGTVLLLIPQGRGQTRLQTPNVVTGIRGSALFVRYSPDTDTTTVGALTTSGIEVTNRDRTQRQPLEAGQMAVIERDRITRVYNFDLRTFYETSDLVQGLNLTGQATGEALDADLAAVQTETVAGLKAQQQTNVASITQNSGSPAGGLTPIDLAFQEWNQLSLLAITQPTLFLPTGTPPSEQRLNMEPFPSGRGGFAGGNGAFAGQGGLVFQTGSGAIAGQGGPLPGVNGNGPIVPNGIPPGQTGSPSSVIRNGPPGLTGTAPGLAGTSPGRGGSGPPGQTGTAPGQSGANPGRGGR